MSVSKWAYDPDKCDGNFCHGDCDRCPKAYGDDEEYPEAGEPCDHFLIPEVNDEDHTLGFHIG